MSDLLSANLKKWRERGDLRYLAHEMQVTNKEGETRCMSTKQVGRYCDKGWIEGSYSTPKGHRRIRYTDDTVERVKQKVKEAKETNIEIRYHISEIIYEGTTIPLEGCTKMQDVERRARKAGLSKQDAKNVAYQPRRSSAASLDPNLDWEYMLMLKGTSQKDVAERIFKLSYVPANYLYEAKDPKEFRARSLDEWRKLESRLEANAGWDGFPRSSQEGQRRRQELRGYLHPFFDQQDCDAFLALYNKEAELDSRITQRDEREGDEEKEREEQEEFENREKFENREELNEEREEREKKKKEREGREMEMKYRKIQADAVENRAAMRLEIAAHSIKRKDQNPSAENLARKDQNPTAENLARLLGISRRTLYRIYGNEQIKATLVPLKNCVKAISATQTKRNKSKKVTMWNGEQRAKAVRFKPA